jgi:hypothetical protein
VKEGNEKETKKGGKKTLSKKNVREHDLSLFLVSLPNRRENELAVLCRQRNVLSD